MIKFYNKVTGKYVMNIDDKFEIELSLNMKTKNDVMQVINNEYELLSIDIKLYAIYYINDVVNYSNIYSTKLSKEIFGSDAFIINILKIISALTNYLPKDEINYLIDIIAKEFIYWMLDHISNYK